MATAATPATGIKNCCFQSATVLVGATAPPTVGSVTRLLHTIQPTAIATIRDLVRANAPTQLTGRKRDRPESYVADLVKLRPGPHPSAERTAATAKQIGMSIIVRKKN